jgi:hypothetical protein
MKGLLILFFFTFLCTVSQANHLLSSEVGKDSLVSVLHRQAVLLCQDKKYEESERAFKQLFKTKDAVLPDEAAYYFGVTSFFLKKYTQARKAFLRFETLKRAPDSLKKESVEFRYDIDCYEKGYYEYPETCLHCHGEGVAAEDCSTCKGNGRQYCPTCSGSGVAVVKSSMGENYSTCSKCGGKGVVDCLACKGTLKVNKSCSVCKGKGSIMMKGECNYE